MNRLNAAALCLLLAAGCKGAASKSTVVIPPIPIPNEATFLSGARFIAGDGSAPIENAAVILYEGKIHHVGKVGEVFAPQGSDQKTGLEDYSIMPMIVNLSAYPGLSGAGKFSTKDYELKRLTSDLNRYAYYGVIAVAAGGDTGGLAFDVRNDQKAGKATGAQLFTSGRGIAANGGSSLLGNVPFRVTSEDEARKAVGELADRKADVIVLWADGMKADTAAALIDEAHKRKLKVFADVPRLVEAKEVVKAGADALVASVRDREVDDEFISLLKEKKVALAPALSSIEARFVYMDKPAWLGESAMREAYPSALYAILGDTVTINEIKRDEQTPVFRQQFETAKKNLKKLADGGVTIAFASGSGLPYTFPGYFEHRELELMVSAGLSPMDVIKAASASSAAALGASDLGALIPGKKANFMIVPDPIGDIKKTREAYEIWINGKQVDRVDLKRNADVKVEGITQAARAADLKRQQDDARKKAEDLLPHYGNGQFVRAESALDVTPGLRIQTPRHSTVTKTASAPFRVTVSYTGKKAEDLRAFYAETLKIAGWTTAGNCWEKTPFKICPEASAGQIILNVTQ
jgi:imidazolonepropionase-like amidohydrolase